ncbi:hypothetical protein C4580_01715 [Candidatus Woesearchaeota archaeon]|nr:MAG: hypothetical protein C4580_01715 [Candidatus Woesearchaeota archaeon]
MKTVILDTNFLIECAKNKVDIQTELTRILDFSFDIAVLDRTLEELDVVAARGGKEGAAAKLARTILLTKKINIIATSGGHTDKLLIERADDNHIIATMDRELKQKLKKKKQDVIIIRGKKKLAVDGA